MNTLSFMSGSSNAFWMEAGNHLWQSTLFGLIIVLIITLLRNIPANTRFFIGWIGLIKFALPSSLLFLAVKDSWPKYLTPKADNYESLLPVHTQFIKSLNPFKDPEFIIIDYAGTGLSTGTNAGISFLSVLGCIWIIGSLFLFLMWQYKLHKYCAELKLRIRPINGSLDRIINLLKNKIGLRININSYFTDDNLEPCVFGIFSPKLIFPAKLVQELDYNELETIILHELIHIKRRDNLLSFIQMLFFCVLWFNPIIWWLNNRLTSECERSCDEEVLNHIKDKRIYTNGIIRVSHFCIGIKIPGFSGASNSNLRNRLESIVGFNGNYFSKGIYQWFIIVSVVLFLVFTTSASGYLSHWETLNKQNDISMDMDMNSVDGEIINDKTSINIIDDIYAAKGEEANRYTTRSKPDSIFNTVTASNLIRLFNPLGVSQTVNEMDSHHVSHPNSSSFNKEHIKNGKKVYPDIEIINQVKPQFPDSVLHLGINKGFANVVFIFDNTRKQRDFVVTASSHPDFGSATIRALKMWEFVPEMLEGVPHTIRVKVEASFDYKGINENHINIIEVAVLRKEKDDAYIHRITYVYRINNLYQIEYVPKLIRHVPPIYPENMKGNTLSGNVLVEFKIDLLGNVKAPRVKSSTHNGFSNAALNAIRRWKFESPIKYGKSDEVKVYQPFNFRNVNLAINN